MTHRCDAIPGLILAVTLIAAPLAAWGAEPEQRTIDDHVFSAAQAHRGQQAYRANCATACHLIEMTGLERAPSLASEGFMQRWNGQTVADLFERIRLTMPQTAPHSLSDQTYIDILAYILSANGLPPGNTDLVPDANVLKTIKFVYTPDKN